MLHQLIEETILFPFACVLVKIMHTYIHVHTYEYRE